MWMTIACATLVAFIPVAAPLLGGSASSRMRDAVFGLMALAAAAGFAAIGHFQASVLYLGPAAVWAAAGVLLLTRALGAPALALLIGVGVLAFGVVETRRAWKATPGVDRIAWGEELEARDAALAARLATRTADERVALLVVDSRHVTPEAAAALARASDVEAVLDLAADETSGVGHEALRAESAFAVAELPLFAVAALNEEARSRGFCFLAPRPYVDLVIAPRLGDRFAEISRTLAQAGAPARESDRHRILVLDGLPAVDDDANEESSIGQALRDFVRRERFAAVLYATDRESRAARDGETTWIGLGREDGAEEFRAVRIVVETFGVEAERLTPIAARRDGRWADPLRFAGAWAHRGARSTLALIAAGAGSLLLLSVGLLLPARGRG